MNQTEIRQAQNYVLSKPLSAIDHPENLQLLALVIQDHDHLREKLMTEPDREKRSLKFDALRPHLQFEAKPLDVYESAEVARRVGVQPFYGESTDLEKKRIIMPPSVPYLTR